MRGLSYHRILAGTALALILAAPSGAYAETPAALETAVPMPEPAGLAPPTAADITAQPAVPTEPAAAEAPATTADHYRDCTG